MQVRDEDVGGSASAHGRLDERSNSVQSRKSRYLVEDGVWRGLQVFQLHRRLQDFPFWVLWLRTPDFMRTPSCRSQDTAQTWVSVCLFALCPSGPQRGFPSGREAVREVEQCLRHSYVSLCKCSLPHLVGRYLPYLP